MTSRIASPQFLATEDGEFDGNVEASFAERSGTETHFHVPERLENGPAPNQQLTGETGGLVPMSPAEIYTIIKPRLDDAGNLPADYVASISRLIHARHKEVSEARATKAEADVARKDTALQQVLDWLRAITGGSVSTTDMVRIVSAALGRG